VYKILPFCKPVSYSSINEAFNKTLKLLGYDAKKFGLHSFRSGGATVSALKKTRIDYGKDMDDGKVWQQKMVM